MYLVALVLVNARLKFIMALSEGYLTPSCISDHPCKGILGFSLIGVEEGSLRVSMFEKDNHS